MNPPEGNGRGIILRKAWKPSNRSAARGVQSSKLVAGEQRALEWRQDHERCAMGTENSGFDSSAGRIRAAGGVSGIGPDLRADRPEARPGRSKTAARGEPEAARPVDPCAGEPREHSGGCAG